MANEFTGMVDTAALDQAIAALPAILRAQLNAAARVTAARVVREMQGRLARQLSPNARGVTVAGILSEASYRGDGYVVRTTDVLSESEVSQRQVWDPTRNASPSAWRRKQAARYRKGEAHVGLYLEKGTKPGRRLNYARTAASPFFYASLALEVPAHERRVLDAMRDSADAVGLGTR